MKKYFIIFLALVLCTVSIVTIFANNEMSQIQKINVLSEKNIVRGDEGGFRLNDKITRAEVAVLVIRLLDEEELATTHNYKGAFDDVSPDLWSNPVMNSSINLATSKGILKGYEDDTFRPSNYITYEEIITILVRTIEPNVQPGQGNAWSAPFLNRAIDLGILDGLSINNYKEPAIRANVFEMIYNTYQILEGENFINETGIVIENQRTSNLDKYEIIIENKDGDKVRINTEDYQKENEELDSEFLLGKVIDVQYNDDGELIDIKIDNSYSYIYGNLEEMGSNHLSIEGRDYSISTNNIYINNKYYSSYRNFRSDYNENDIDWLKATVKNGEVHFIDGFAFKDIAPVKEVHSREIDVIDDKNVNSLYTIRRSDYDYFILIDKNNDEISLIEFDDIKEEDVVHFFDNTILVRRDSVLEGVLDDVVEERINREDKLYLEIYRGEDYFFNFNEYKKAVYNDGRGYKAVSGVSEKTQLQSFINQEIYLLLDLNNNVQYLKIDNDISSGVALVKDISSRDITIVTQNGRVDKFRVDNKTRFDGKNIDVRNLGGFEKGDLVYFDVYSEDILDELILIETNDYIINNATRISEIDEDRIIVDGRRNFIDSNTYIFINNGREINSVSIDYLIDNYDYMDRSSQPLTYDNVKGTLIRDGRNTIIIFTDIDRETTESNQDILRVVDIITNNREYILVLENERGRVEDYIVPSNSRAYRSIRNNDIELDDIVEVSSREVRGEIEVDDIELLISFADDNIYEVVEFRRDQVVLADRRGNEKRFWLSKDFLEFDRISTGSLVQIHEDRFGEINIISEGGRTLRGNFDGDDFKKTSGYVDYVNSRTIDIEGVEYSMDSSTYLLNSNGRVIARGGVEIADYLIKDDFVEILELDRDLIIDLKLID